MAPHHSVQPQSAVDEEHDRLPGAGLAAAGFAVGLVLTGLEWIPMGVAIAAGIVGALLVVALTFWGARQRQDEGDVW